MTTLLVAGLFGGGFTYKDFYRAHKDAEALFRKGDYRKAERIYRKILRPAYKFGFGKEVRYRIAEALYNQGKFDKAIREWEKLAKEKDVKGTYLEQEIAYEVALAYAIKGDISLARQKLLELQKYPYYKNSSRTKFLDGVIAYREGKFLEASEKLAQAKDDVVEAKFYYARALSILKRPLDAVAIYKELLEKYSGTPQEALIYYGMVEANFMYGDYKATSELAKVFTERFHGHKLSDYVQYYWGIALYRMALGEGGKQDTTLLPKALEKLTLLTKKRNFELAGLAAYFVGNIQMALKNYDEALRYYQIARARANDNIVTFISFLRMAEAYYYKGDTSNAYLLANQLSSFPLGDEEKGISEYLTGSIHYLLKKYRDAMEQYQFLIENYEKSFFRRPAMALMVFALINQRDFDAAMARGNLYNEEVSKDTAFTLWNSWFVHALAEAHYYKGDYANAEKLYNMNLRAGLHRDIIVLSRLGLGWVYIHQDRLQDAKAYLESILGQSTDTSIVIATHLGLGVVLFNLGQYQEAFAKFYGIYIFAPERSEVASEALYYSGYAAKALQSYGDAVRNWDLTMQKYPDQPKACDAAFGSGDIYRLAGEWDNAIARLRWFLEHCPDHEGVPQAHLWIAQSYEGKQAWDEAKQEYKTILSQFPDSDVAEDAKKGLERVYFNIVKEEPERINEMMEDLPTSEVTALALYKAAADAMQAGDELKAADIFFQLGNTFPQSSKAEEALFYAGSLYLKNKKAREAIDAFKKYKDFFPDGQHIEDVMFYLASAYLQVKEYPQAIETAKEFVKRFPNSQKTPDAYRIMGAAYIELGDVRNAANALRQAADLYEQQGRATEAQQMKDLLKSLPQ
ncbi:MAG: tetratricopeptide repeat protein [Thermotogae bacterium]|nr:tetratricopeptide repeat protein [Thermotogota bacterium]